MRKFINNYDVALSANINATQTSVVVVRTPEASLPAFLTDADHCLLTLDDGANNEIIRVVAINASSSDVYTLTVQRNVVTDPLTLITAPTGTGFAFLAASTRVKMNDTADILNRVGMFNRLGEDPVVVNAFNFSGANAVYTINPLQQMRKYTISANGASHLTINPITPDPATNAGAKSFFKTWILFERYLNTYNWPQIRYNNGGAACPIEGTPPASNLHAVLEITHCGQHPYVHFKWLTLAANL